MLGEANFDDFLDWGLVWGCEAGVFIQYLLGTQGVSKYPGPVCKVFIEIRTNTSKERPKNVLFAMDVLVPN